MVKKRDTLNKLKQQEREIRENLIIDAARTVFGAKTYDQVSMNEIAKAAGIAKSSIYTYFPNQEALFVETAFRDTEKFIAALKKRIQEERLPSLETFINDYLDYNIEHDAHWRMITHFALHGNIGKDSAEKLNRISRQVLDLLETVLKKIDYRGDTRLLSHTLFAALSGIMISFRKYPGRTKQARIVHMKRIAKMVERMLMAYVRQDDCLPDYDGRPDATMTR
ncbi:MAG: TetR/AcrR family transcriptional regulator [Desulfosarcina sp.]|nr:TetR/AcrR family transcriptional regulator [Desulfosarcina sp.]MBC2742355.1 TetR/AcrR family transcriptional regulator [Desulfosarcina sp.]MBC2765266.1 TetR/AcrR family transcriptional regulator [Desulfosarcina sp.]